MLAMDSKAEGKEDELFRSVVAWLVSLRIPRQDAREYANALREFGFDDMQSLQEDVTEEDLHHAGMKPGHVRRMFKALRALDARGANENGRASTAGFAANTKVIGRDGWNDTTAPSNSPISSSNGSNTSRRDKLDEAKSPCNGCACLEGEATATMTTTMTTTTTPKVLHRGAELSVLKGHRCGDESNGYRIANGTRRALGVPEAARRGKPVQSLIHDARAPHSTTFVLPHPEVSCKTGDDAPTERARTTRSQSGPVGTSKKDSEMPKMPVSAIEIAGRTMTRVEIEGEGKPLMASSCEKDSSRGAGERLMPRTRQRGCARSLKSINSDSKAQPIVGGLFHAADDGESTSSESEEASEDLEPSLSSGESSNDDIRPTTRNEIVPAVVPGYGDHPQGRLALRRELSRDRRSRGVREEAEENCHLLRMPLLATPAAPGIEKQVGRQVCSAEGKKTGLVPDMSHARLATVDQSHYSMPPLGSSADGAQAPYENRSVAGHAMSSNDNEHPHHRRAVRIFKTPAAESPTAGTSSVNMIGRGHVKTLQRIRSIGRIGGQNKIESYCSLNGDVQFVPDPVADSEERATPGLAPGKVLVDLRVREKGDSAEAEIREDMGRRLALDVETYPYPIARGVQESNGHELPSSSVPDQEGECVEETGGSGDSAATTSVRDGFGLSLVLNDENSPIEADVTSAYSRRGSQVNVKAEDSANSGVERWGVACGAAGLSDGVVEGAGIGGVSLDLSILSEQHMDRSYDFSDNGTLHIQGFILKPDGMKSAPGLSSKESVGRGTGSSTRASAAEKGRGLRPPSLKTTFETDERTPRSSDSWFGRPLSGGRSGDFGGSNGGRWEGGSAGKTGCSSVDVPSPLTTTMTPRPMRETTILLEEIGRGGGGTVHKAMHVPSMRLVAVKMIEVHDHEKRRQMIKELKALHSMNRVPLLPPSHQFDDWQAYSSASSENWSCDEADSPEWVSDGAECFSSKAGIQTPSVTATVTITPYSQERTLSSCQDGTPPSLSAQPSAPGARGSHNQGSQILERPESSFGFPPGSRGSAGGVSSGVFHAGASLSTYSETNDNGGGASSTCARRSTQRPRERRKQLPVVAFHDAYTETENGCVCMVMEYMDGGTLQQFISRGQALSESSLATVARSVLRGLTEMHAKHQIHRDIKPSNILVDRHGRVKISDFGVVRELTRTGSLATTFTGTLTYMSPERITERDYSYPSDVWSLGLVIVALALGKFPLSTRGGYFEMVQAIANDPVPALSPTSFSPELCNFVELMLQRDPADRAPARALLQHPFLLHHRESRKLVGMVEVPPATRAQIDFLLKKIVDHHLEASLGDRGCFEDMPPVIGGSGLGSAPVLRCGRWCLIPPLRKADLGTLAGQLQVTRTELVEHYEHIRKRVEQEWVAEGGKLLHQRRGRRHHASLTPRIVHGGRRFVSTMSEPCQQSSAMHCSQFCVESPLCPRRSHGRGGGGCCDSASSSGMSVSDAPPTASTAESLASSFMSVDIASRRSRRRQSQGRRSLSGALRSSSLQDLCGGAQTAGSPMARTVC